MSNKYIIICNTTNAIQNVISIILKIEVQKSAPSLLPNIYSPNNSENNIIIKNITNSVMQLSVYSLNMKL